MDSVVEEMFETQKYHPITGWVFAQNSDRAGNIQSYSDDSPPHVELDPEWVWTHDWIPDMGYTQCDEEGWSYGMNVARLNIHLAQGTSRAKKEAHHFVRRRRWIRTRVRKSQLEYNGEDGDSSSSQEVDASKEKKRFKVHKDSSLSHILHARSADTGSFLHLEFDEDDIVKEGWLGKRGSFSRNWKLRYFILRQDTNSLVYLKDKKYLIQLGEVHINGHTTIRQTPTDSPQQYHFVILNGDRQLKLNATDGVTRAEWISVISEMIVQCRASFLEATVKDRKDDEGDERNGDDEGMDDSACESGDCKGCTNCQHQMWRPYGITCSTMNRKLDVIDEYYKTYYKNSINSLEDLIKDTTLCILHNIDELEANIRETVARTSTQLTEPMLRELEHMRQKVTRSRDQFYTRIESMRQEGSRRDQLQLCPPSILIINQNKRDLYVQAKHWLDALVVHAQVTLKPAYRNSPKGRIPLQWFEDGDQYEQSIERSSDVLQTTQANSQDDNIMTTRRYSSAQPSNVQNSVFFDFDPIISRTSNRIKQTLGKRRPPTVKGIGFELPEKLEQGHPELPVGINKLVVFVHEKDLGSIIAFTLCSNAYAHELHSQQKCLDVLADLSLEQCVTMSAARTRETFKSHIEVLYSDIQRHIDLDFSFETKTHKHHVRCVAFFAAQFHALRHTNYPGNLGYMESLSSSSKWNTSGGKSGAGFSMTHDKRLILKEIPLTEFNMFVHMAPAYFKYLARVMEHDSPTVMSKILGLYKITRSKGSSKHVNYVIVMENVVVGVEVSQMYDLKGLVRRRFVDETSPQKVLQDGNFMGRVPVPVLQTDLNIFTNAVDNDTEFLSKLGVIDYSLLLAFDEVNRQLVVGMIDYLHQFDFLKKMESTSKASITFHNPTIISPEPYRKRLRDEMQRYFVGIKAPMVRRMSQPVQFRTLNLSRGRLSRSNTLPINIVSSFDKNFIAETTVSGEDELVSNQKNSLADKDRTLGTSLISTRSSRTNSR